MTGCIFIIFTYITAGLVPGDPYAEADRLYKAQRYSEALMLYERIIEEDTHAAESYHNAGNICYHIRLYGRAIWYYRQALALNPGDEETINNLRLAESALHKPPPASAPLSVKGIMKNLFIAIPVYTVLAVLILSWYLMFYFIITGVTSGGERKEKAYRLIKYPAFIIAASLMMVAGDAMYLRNYTEAVILKNQAEVRSEPSAESHVNQTLHEGWRAEVIEIHPEWLFIRLENGKEGWIRSEAAGLIRHD